MSALNLRVLLSGVIAGWFFALPAALIVRAVDSGIVSSVMLGVVFFSGALAGYAAARPHPPRAFLHGALAGAVTLLGAQLLYTVGEGSFPNPIALAFWLLAFASLGTISAYTALWRAANMTDRER